MLNEAIKTAVFASFVVVAIGAAVAPAAASDSDGAFSARVRDLYAQDRAAAYAPSYWNQYQANTDHSAQ